MIPPASTGATISPDGKEIWIGGHGDGNQVNEKVLVYSLQKRRNGTFFTRPVYACEHNER